MSLTGGFNFELVHLSMGSHNGVSTVGRDSTWTPSRKQYSRRDDLFEVQNYLELYLEL